jgi:hypothetical protein
MAELKIYQPGARCERCDELLEPLEEQVCDWCQYQQAIEEREIIVLAQALAAERRA